MVTRTLRKTQSIPVEVKAGRIKDYLLKTDYYRAAVKVSFLLIFLTTFSVIVLLSRLLSVLYFVLGYASRQLKKVKPIGAEERKTKPGFEVERERRRYPRFNVYWPVRFNQIGSSVNYDGRVTNLSKGGMLIQSSEQMEIGQRLRSKVSFILDSEINTIEMHAEVVRRNICSGKTSGNYQCGTKFLDISQGDKNKLDDLLMSLSPAYSS